MTTRIRLLIADDHPVVRAGLSGMLGAQPDFEILGEAANGVEAVNLATRLQPDVVLMDLRMPELDGVAAILRIVEQCPAVAILVLTTYDSDTDILPAIEAGATGYLLKDAPREELFRAIRAAAQGQSVLAPSVATRLMGQIRTAMRSALPATESLSLREIEVLGLVARGASNKQIARTLHISEATVKTHLIHIFGKLGVDDRTAAVTTALERGVLRLEGQEG